MSEGIWFAAKYNPGEMHCDVNAGDKPIEVTIVELKHDK
jgi:hypothetical protein